MQESLALFQSLKELGGFERVHVFVLLNKIDIFEQLITEIPISDFYPEYTGGADLFKACRFFADKFYDIGKHLGLTTSVYPMSAVNPGSVKDVAICIRNSLISGRSADSFVTARSWDALDWGFKRSRRSYMQTSIPFGVRERPVSGDYGKNRHSFDITRNIGDLMIETDF